MCLDIRYKKQADNPQSTNHNRHGLRLIFEWNWLLRLMMRMMIVIARKPRAYQLVSIITFNLSHLWKWKWASSHSTYAGIPLSQTYQVTLDDDDNDDNDNDNDDDDDNSFKAKGLPTQLMPESHFPRGKSTEWHLRWDKSIFAWWKLSVTEL